MTLKALCGEQEDLAIGQLWRIAVESSDLPTLTVLLPDGSTLTPAVEFDQDMLAAPTQSTWGWPTYRYVAEFAPQDAGRYIGAVTAADESGLLFQAWVSAVTPNTSLPDADTLDEWLGVGEHSFTPGELADAMAIAGRQQRKRCRVPATYPEDLAEALHRRAGRYLYGRRALAAEPRTDADYGTPPTFPPGRDFTVRELETPYYKLPIG